MIKFFKKLFGGKKPYASSSNMIRAGAAIRRRIPRKIRSIRFNPKNISIENVSEHSAYYRWGLTLLGIFLVAAVSSRIVGLLLRPVYTPLPQKRVTGPPPTQTAEDFSAIENRNIFNVENRIPEPFDQGLLDCLSQARPSSARIQLMGTIVMRDEALSVALVSDDSNQNKYAVKKDEMFSDGKYVALKVERKKLCFQVKATQDLEYIEIPEEGGIAGILMGGSSSDGIQPTSATSYAVRKDFLDSKIGNLPEILQTAKAVPYTEGSKMKGFLIQSIEPNSPFAELGIRQGDVLTGVNDIVLDNAGRGLEAFNQLRNSSKIEIRILRGGQETTLNYEVK